MDLVNKSVNPVWADYRGDAVFMLVTQILLFAIVKVYLYPPLPKSSILQVYFIK